MRQRTISAYTFEVIPMASLTIIGRPSCHTDSDETYGTVRRTLAIQALCQLRLSILQHADCRFKFGACVR